MLVKEESAGQYSSNMGMESVGGDRMKQALGLVEVQGLSVAVVAADAMVKAANVRILEIENTKGLGYMTVKVAGDVGAVNASVSAGCQIGMMNQKLVSWKVIARPSDYVEQTFCGLENVPKAKKPEQAATEKTAASAPKKRSPQKRSDTDKSDREE